MRKHFLFIVIAALLLGVSAWASEPWKDKAFADWDAKDVQRVLTDSPWARQFTVNVPPDSAGAGDQGYGRRGTGGGSARNTRAGLTNGATSDAARNLTMYIARWYSSRTIRQAEVRAAQLRGTSDEHLQEVLATVPAAYQLIVRAAGADMPAFAGVDDAALRQRTWLELKKSHQKIAPVSVRLLRSQDGSRIFAVVVEFPKKTDGGEPTIAASETDAEFVTGSGNLTLKFHYDLDKMVNKDGSDL